MSTNTLLVKKDGSEIPVGDSAAPFIDENGKIIGVIVIFRDLTQEKAASALKSDFAYASHQLRTPVTKALWGLEAAIHSQDAQQIKGPVTENLQLAYLAIKSVKKLTESIQAVSKVDQGLVIAKPEKTALVPLIHQIITEQTTLTNTPADTFVVNSPNENIAITTDPKLLNYIFSAIINNSIIYSASLTPTKKPIIIHLSPQSEGTLIEIIDQGIGIVEEEQPTVFTKFFRGSNFNTTEIAGTGLGLYLCREYIKLLGAKIWFDSQPTQGTTFSVFLPTKN